MLLCTNLILCHSKTLDVKHFALSFTYGCDYAVFVKLFAINEWSKDVVKYFATKKNCSLHCTLYVKMGLLRIYVIQDLYEK